MRGLDGEREGGPIPIRRRVPVRETDDRLYNFCVLKNIRNDKLAAVPYRYSTGPARMSVWGNILGRWPAAIQQGF